MAKCMQVVCEEEGILYEFEGQKYILCSYHAGEVSNVIRTQRGIGINTNSDYEDCDYCRGAYDEQGRYDPANGKVFGRFNKRTQECEFFGCKKSAFYKQREYIRNLPKECQHCNKKIKGGEEFHQLNGGKIFFCSSSHQEDYLKAQKEKLAKEREEEAKKAVEQMERLRKEEIETKKIKELWNEFYLHVKTQKSLFELYPDWEEKIKIFPEDCRNTLHKYQKKIEEIQAMTQQERINTEKANDNLFTNSCENSSNNQQSNPNPLNISNNDSSPSNNNSNSSSNNDSKKPSLKLNIDPSSYHFNDSNLEQDSNFKKAFKEIFEKVNKGDKSTILLSANFSKQQRIFLNAFQTAKILNSYVCINALDLPQDKKEELNQLFKNLQNIPSMNLGGNVTRGFNPLPLRILIIVSILTLIAFPILLVIRKRRLKNLKESK